MAEGTRDQRMVRIAEAAWREVIDHADQEECRSWIGMLRETWRPMNLSRYGRGKRIRQFRARLLTLGPERPAT